MVYQEEIIHSNAAPKDVLEFAKQYKILGGLGFILPGAYYDQMKVD